MCGIQIQQKLKQQKRTTAREIPHGSIDDDAASTERQTTRCLIENTFSTNELSVSRWLQLVGCR